MTGRLHLSWIRWLYEAEGEENDAVAAVTKQPEQDKGHGACPVARGFCSACCIG
jgi:hypothetical protein